ncbi:hypothetical protein GOV09_04545 [Candidatus Woesearchaeota archaeon]|nr:hypothetical protein [Candidatus Woesearchaeota archaeon]
MLVFAFSLLILVPIISILQSEYSESKQTLDESQASQILNELAIAAQGRYYSGYPARTTLDLYFPRGIIELNSIVVDTDEGKKSEIFALIQRGRAEVKVTKTVPFAVNITLKNSDGRRKILIKAEKDNYVNITDPVE